MAAETEGPETERRQEVVRQIRDLAASVGLTIRLEEADAPKRAGTDKERPRQSSAETPVFQLTERDIEIIRTVNQYRYLRTGQIARLLFPENRSRQSAQRRLRLLSHPGHRYLDKIQPYAQQGKEGAGNDTAYFLGAAGVELLRQNDEEIQPPGHGSAGRASPSFLEHALDLSEFRLKMELALRGHPLLELHRFTMDFELKEGLSRRLRRKAYKLHHEIHHPRVNKTFLVYPDALIILRGRDRLRNQQRLFFLEIDRSSMSLGRIRDKIIGYHLFLEQNVFRKYGAFTRFRVLLQTNSPRRADNIRTALADIEGEELVWITDESQVTGDSILAGRIWCDFQNRRQCIVRQEAAAS